MENPMSMKIFQSKESLQHVSFDVSKSENDTGVFYNNLQTKQHDKNDKQ